MADIARNHHIQALRGVAASLVVLDHCLEVLVDRGILPLWIKTAGYSIGGLGVTTFFVISGFIMVNISYDDFGRSPRALSFARRRIIRIVPTYWIATLLAFFFFTVMSFGQHPSVLELIKSLTFVPYSADPNSEMHPVLGQGWTLNYEMFFYALFTLALFFPRRLGLTLVFSVFVAMVVGRSFLKPFSDTTPANTVYTFLADPMILLFAAGMVIGVLHRVSANIFQLRHPFWFALGFLGFQIACLLVFDIPARVPFPEVVLTWIPGSLAVIACAFALPMREGWVERISEAMGDASYSTYLFHVFVVTAFKLVFPITQATALLFVLAVLLSANLFGIVFFKVVERQLSNVIRGLSAKPRIVMPKAA